MKKTTGLRTYLLRNYLALYVVSLTINGALGVVILSRQLEDVRGIFTHRIANVVAIEKNELLNEIALNDQDSLAQHIEMMRHDLGVDEIAVVHDAWLIRARGPTDEAGFADRLIRRLISIRPIEDSIANEFSDVRAKVFVSFDRSFVRWLARPIAKLLAGIFLTSMITTGGLFLILFGLLDRRLIRPLEHVTDELGRGSSAPSARAARDFRLTELNQLRRATLRFRELIRAAAFARVARQVAHDVRSPLGALRMVSKTLGKQPDSVSALLGSAIDRIEEIAQDLVSESRHVRAEEWLRPVLMNDLVGQMVREKQVQLRGDDGEIQFRMGVTDEPCLVRGHAAEIKRVMSNLLQNAIEAIPRRGIIRVELYRAARAIVVSITDDGRGIPAEQLGRIGTAELTFGKDHLAGSGSGLGLMHAFATAHALGGELKIQSRPGAGTTVTLRLPSVDGPAAPAEVSAPAPRAETLPS